jgi:hypothetical protein
VSSGLQSMSNCIFTLRILSFFLFFLFFFPASFRLEIAERGGENVNLRCSYMDDFFFISASMHDRSG